MGYSINEGFGRENCVLFKEHDEVAIFRNGLVANSHPLGFSNAYGELAMEIFRYTKFVDDGDGNYEVLYEMQPHLEHSPKKSLEFFWDALSDAAELSDNNVYSEFLSTNMFLFAEQTLKKVNPEKVADFIENLDLSAPEYVHLLRFLCGQGRENNALHFFTTIIARRDDLMDRVIQNAKYSITKTALKAAIAMNRQFMRENPECFPERVGVTDTLKEVRENPNAAKAELNLEDAIYATATYWRNAVKNSACIRYEGIAEAFQPREIADATLDAFSRSLQDYLRVNLQSSPFVTLETTSNGAIGALASTMEAFKIPIRQVPKHASSYTRSEPISADVITYDKVAKQPSKMKLYPPPKEINLNH